MKTILAAINAKYIHSNLAVYSLKKYAEGHGMDSEIAEYTINQRTEEILIDLYKKNPDLLAFSCYIWNIGYVLEIAQEVKKILPDVDIWLGGPEVSYDALKVLTEQPYIRGVMRGEGEAVFTALLKAYHETDRIASLRNVKGISYRSFEKEQEIIEQEAQERISMDDIPFVYEDLTEFENRIIYYETSRGCPFSCSYCLSSIDKKVRFRSLSLVFEELAFFLRNKVPQVKFVDRTFNCVKSHSRAIWQYLIDHDNGVTNFHFEISADLLEEEDIALFRQMRPGLIQLEIGVQSANMDTIREIHRTMNLLKVGQMVEKVRALGNIHCHLDLIAGLPYEDYESFRRSYGIVYEMKPDQLQLGFLKVLKGSYMQEHAKEYEVEAKSTAPYEVLCTKWLSFADVIRLKLVEEMTEIYYNSGQYAHTAAAISDDYENPFDFYMELGVYYESCGYLKKSSSRAAKYEILLGFIEEKYKDDFKKLEGLKELLLLDYYLREHAKTRPQWAKDLTEYKDQIRDFYRQEEEERRYLVDYEGFAARQLSKMTHLEVFSYPILQTDKPWEAEKGVYPVLFDYKRRNPLNQDAKIHLLRGI